MTDNESTPHLLRERITRDRAARRCMHRNVIGVDKMLRACEELEAIFEDFYDIYGVTDKDKYALMARLVEWKINNVTEKDKDE